MQSNRAALVTGANKGIGRQIAKDLAAEGVTVILGSRDLARGEVVAAEIGGDATAVRLDVTDQASIAAAAALVAERFGHLDILVNNAGISHAGGPDRPFDEILASGRMSTVAMPDLRRIFDVNVFGVLAVTQAMLPLLRAAGAAQVVIVSSGAGSLTLHSDPDNPSRAKFGAYSASKTALNGITMGLAIDLEPMGIKVNAACPGFTATDLNAFLGTQPVEVGAKRAVELALMGPDGPTGTFSANSGPMPW